MTTALNWLHLGSTPVQSLSAPRVLSAAQRLVRATLARRVSLFLSEGGHVADQDWAGYLKRRCMDYSGDMVVKAVPLTMAQLQTTLPGIGLGGSIDILSVVSPEHSTIPPPPRVVSSGARGTAPRTPFQCGTLRQ